MRTETEQITVTLDFKTYPARFTCEGENISPRIRIKGLDTPYFALILEDPDAPGGTYTHWTFWNAESIDDIPENVSLTEKPPELPGALQGINSEGDLGYTGPCPPRGSVHRYYVKVYGLGSPLDLSPGAQVADLKKALQGKYAQYGEAMATFHR
jgi:Raf kinase inhibitor-like YbhB/YbcL family protein